ncbi:DAK2 domain-containing protein [Nocardia uniformis]|uniref:DAK2 domain-containing protein n=1 Tax=Nocardia uniformis TaxID=53432 RepID=UPI000ADDAEEC|nr:DAK2 domain-containing protein [Nocardia uniformis]
MPGVGDVLDGAALTRWGRRCLEGLERHRDEINALNVFPVADADTGTNLLTTMRAAVLAAEEAARPGGSDAAAGDVSSAAVVAKRGSERSDAPAGAVRDSTPGGAVDRNPVGRADTPSLATNAPNSVDGPVGSGVTAHSVAAAMARAATLGARGNSGIILSQVLRGVAEAVSDGPLTAESLRLALRRAAVLVREALSSPVEGTMLTILDCAADHAAECQERTLRAVALAAADGAVKALGETTSQLGVLREAGVVDAGARGLLVLLDELVTVTGGTTPTRPRYVRGGSGGMPIRGASGAGADRSDISTDLRGAHGDPIATRAGAHPQACGLSGAPGAADESGLAGSSRVANESGMAGSPDAADEGGMGGSPRAASESGPAVGRVGGAASDFAARMGDSADSPMPAPQYEVMYLLDGTDEEQVTDLRDALAGLGDSVVVVGDGAGAWSAHVHCADAGAAVEAGLSAGVLSRIRIETLAVSMHATLGPTDRGILAAVSGPGAVRLFEDSGATVLEGEVTSEALLTAIRAMPHREVLVLPNGALPAHELVAVSVAARDGMRDVLMLPCSSVVQGLAALSMHDSGRIAVDDVFAMSEAAAGTRWGSLRVAAERALTIQGTCAAGDGLGLVGHDVVVIDPDVRAAARTLLDRMLGLGGELVTMLIGAEAPDGLADELSDHIAAGFPGVEVVVYPGGQAGDLVQIGVE